MEEIILFPTLVLKESVSQFLPALRTVAKRYLDKISEGRKMDEVYPVVQTWSFHGEPEVQEFNQVVLKAAWEALLKQGYDMTGLGVAIQAMWFQDHHKLSSMERHTHPAPTQFVGFYFIDVPEEKTSWLVLDDPRPGKVQSEPYQRQSQTLQVATQRVSFKPKEGELFLTPAWLPHGLTRNGSDWPFLLAHINVMLIPMQSPPAPQPRIL